MAQAVSPVSDADFSKEVLGSTEPVLVDFWAEWCGPCRMLSPVFEEVAAEYKGRVKFVKVNVDENPETPAKYAVRGIPTLILFKNGTPEATKVGGMSKSQLKAFIDAEI